MENTKLKKEYKLPSSEEYEQTHRIPIIADKEMIERLGFFGRNIKVGDVGSRFPELNNAKEMIERFKNYDAVKLFEWEIKNFERTYGKEPTIDIIKYELEEINKFIESAKQRNLRDAFKHHDYSIYAILPVNEELEYLRLTNGFYEAKVSDSMNYSTVFHPNAKRVYGRCMLFKEWLEEKLNNIESFQNTSSVATNNKNNSVGNNTNEGGNISTSKASETTVQTDGNINPQFSVLEWATIFYYADETKLLPESRLIKIRLEQFVTKHHISTTFNNFKTKYYNARKRINEKNDYPIDKLELIIPFLEENYQQTVTKVNNDISYLKENNSDYQ